MFFLFFFVKVANINFTLNYFKNKENYYQFFSFFSVFTVIFFVFEKFNFISVYFFFNDNNLNIIYFVLFPIELLFVSIIEEFFFRTFMFDKLKNYSFQNIIIVSSILFSLSHLPSSLIDFMLLFFSALIYGVIYYKTKKIKYSIILHFTTNFSILFFGLHSEVDFSKIVRTTNNIYLINYDFNSSDIIVLISETIILLYFLIGKSCEPKLKHTQN
jgi:membrane protease YdiL (CAAX protease family)